MRLFSRSPPKPPTQAESGLFRSPRRELTLAVAGVAAFGAWARMPVRSATRAPCGVEIAEMTWMDVRDAIAAGWRTAIVPSGGLEQNGPHMIIGKHDYLVRWAAQRIALELGHALVTPVVSYVPEGTYDPPSGHMQFPGTLGVPEPVFEAVLDGIARSLKDAGFTTICFIADHGGSVAPQARLVARLAAEWRGHGVQVIDVDAYYGQRIETCWLHDHGQPDSAIGAHASIADTSELLAVHPEGVDLDRVPAAAASLPQLGSSGDPRRSTVQIGDALMTLKVRAAVRQIAAATARA